MKIYKYMFWGIVLSFLLFFIALIIFNDISFILMGIGIMILGVIIIIKININKEE